MNHGAAASCGSIVVQRLDNVREVKCIGNSKGVVAEGSRKRRKGSSASRSRTTEQIGKRFMRTKLHYQTLNLVHNHKSREAESYSGRPKPQPIRRQSLVNKGRSASKLSRHRFWAPALSASKGERRRAIHGSLGLETDEKGWPMGQLVRTFTSRTHLTFTAGNSIRRKKPWELEKTPLPPAGRAWSAEEKGEKGQQWTNLYFLPHPSGGPSTLLQTSQGLVVFKRLPIYRQGAWLLLNSKKDGKSAASRE